MSSDIKKLKVNLLEEIALPIVLGVIASCPVATAFQYWQTKTQA